MLTPIDTPQDDMFLTGSMMAAVIADHDWSSTTLGTLDGWPSTLRAVLTTLLASPFPIVLAWGPELITFHNDAYCELLGGRRDAIGLPFLDVWPELREDLGPLFERALSGQTCHFPEASFTIERNGRQEEAIFNFGLSPVRDVGGAVVGVFNVGVEITARVVAHRQQASERERLARMFEQAPGFMAILEGPEHRIVLANAAYLKLVGHRAVLGKTVAEALPDAVSQGLGDVLDRVYASGEAHHSSGAKFEARNVPGGPVEERYVDVVFQPLTNEAGDVTGVFLEGADVTDRVHAAAELRLSERRNGEILESVSDAFYAVDANWRFTYVNRKAEQLWGRPREELLGRTIWSVFPQAVNSETYEAHQRAATMRELVRIEAMSPVLGRWVDVSIFPTDGGGLSVYFRDVTERREAQARFRTLLETAPALIFATDQKGQNTFVNQRYQDYTGWTFDDLVGDGWLAVVHPEDRAAAIRESFEGRSESRPLERRLRLRRRDGEWLWFLSRVEPVLEAGPEAEFAWLGISIEIEDQVRAEERERLLSQEVDHRAKNLLAVVQSVVQLTRADDVPVLKEAIDGRIQALARSHGLLSAARWEGVELRDLVDEELAAFAGAVSVSGPSIRLKAVAAQSLGLVLHELATNAVKYGSLSSSSGTLRVNWSLIGEAVAQALVISWLEQGGPAVTPPTSRGFGSTVIRTSVERQLNGKVQTEWRVEGLRCELSLPSEQLVSSKTQQGASTKPSRGAQPIRPCLEGKSVLVVEDEALIAMQMEEALAEAGCTVLGPTATMSEAVDLVVTGAPAAALLDVNLGGERSFPVADILQAKGIPFAFCTGYAGAADLPERFRTVPMIAKPFNQKILVQVLTGLIPPKP